MTERSTSSINLSGPFLPRKQEIIAALQYGIDLYDRSLNYKGCMSCFACKVKGGLKGICSFKDDLQPILEKAMEVDVLVCGSPVYTAYPSANLRAFMERLIFPAVNYSDFRARKAAPRCTGGAPKAQNGVRAVLFVPPGHPNLGFRVRVTVFRPPGHRRALLVS